jgi:hypothetical protein
MNKAKLKRLKYTWSSDRPSRLSYEKSERQQTKKEIRKALEDSSTELVDKVESKGDVPDGSQ